MPNTKSDISIIAKLHDLLKLGGCDLHHFCPTKHPKAADMERVHPHLWKALRHHCVSWYWQKKHQCGLKQMDRETFCISYADHKASAISRRLRRLLSHHLVIHVWKHEHRTDEEFKPIEAIFEQALDSRDLKKLYSDHLTDMEERSETANTRDGSSFTSLRTHAELTASWADFLLRNADRYRLPVGTDSAYRFRKPLEKGKVVLVRCKIRTHGRLARLRDLQMVRDIEVRKKLVVRALGRVSLYELPDEILIPMHPDLAEEIGDLLKPTLSTNHFIEFTPAPSPFLNAKGNGEGFLHNFHTLFGDYTGSVYPDLDDTIEPNDEYPASQRAILCDLCQLAQARVEYHDAFPGTTDPVPEYLCQSCAGLRKRSKTRARNLTTWERSVDNDEERAIDDAKARPRVCVVKVSLDMAELVSALKNAFQTTFREKLKDRPLDGHDLGFSILQEFVLDYNRFVKKFEESILALHDGRYSGDSHDHILDGFMALRIESDSEVADITREYVKLYDQYFPRLKGPTFPVKLSISCSHIKHPFLEHWEVLDKPTSAINVQSVRRAQVGLSFEQFEALESFGRNPEPRVSGFLHRLAEIYDRTGSELLVKFTLLDKDDNERRVVEPFMNGTVNPSQILNYYKLFVQDAKR